MRNRLSLAMTTMAACLAASQVARPADWPQRRGPNGNGASSETGIATTWPAQGPKKVWQYKIGPGHASPVIADKRLYTLGGGNIICLDAITGELLWKCPLGEKGTATLYYTPAVDGKVVYGISDRGHLVAADTADGKPLWDVDLLNVLALTIKDKDPLPLGSPLVLADKLVLSRGLALDKATGKVIWKVDELAANPRYETPAPFTVGNIRGLLFYNGPKLIAVTADKGETLWSVALPYWAKNSYADPVILPDFIFFDGAPLKLAEDKADLVKVAKGLGASLATPVPWKGFVYASCGGWGGNPKPGSYQLKCVDPRTAQVKWSQPGIWGPLLVADDKVLVAAHTGELVMVKAAPDGFQELARAMIFPGAAKDVCWAAPALSDGKLYLRGTGQIVCLDVSGK